MSIDDYPIIDTSELDLLVSHYDSLQRNIDPSSLLGLTADGHVVEDELFSVIRNSALRNLSGVAVVASAQFALGLDDLDQVEPSMVVVDDRCTFTGRIVDVAVYDFTKAVVAAGMMKPGEDTAIMPGLVFGTDATLEDFTDTLGILSLSPYCVLMPGSLYELRKIPHAWRR